MVSVIDVEEEATEGSGGEEDEEAFEASSGTFPIQGIPRIEVRTPRSPDESRLAEIGGGRGRPPRGRGKGRGIWGSAGGAPDSGFNSEGRMGIAGREGGRNPAGEGI